MNDFPTAQVKRLFDFVAQKGSQTSPGHHHLAVNSQICLKTSRENGMEHLKISSIPFDFVYFTLSRANNGSQISHNAVVTIDAVQHPVRNIQEIGDAETFQSIFNKLGLNPRRAFKRCDIMHKGKPRNQQSSRHHHVWYPGQRMTVSVKPKVRPYEDRYYGEVSKTPWPPWASPLRKHYCL